MWVRYKSELIEHHIIFRVFSEVTCDHFHSLPHQDECLQATNIQYDGLCKCLFGVNLRAIELKDKAIVLSSLHHKSHETR